MPILTSQSCPKCINGTLHLDPLENDWVCINCSYTLILSVALSAHVASTPKRKAEKANIHLDYYLTPYYQK